MSTITGVSSTSVTTLSSQPVAAGFPAPPATLVNVSSTGSSTFNILGPQAKPTVSVGADLGPNFITPLINSFINLTGKPLNLRRIKYGNTIPKNLSSSFAAGDLGTRKVFFDFEPDSTNTPAQLNTFLKSCNTAGLNASVSLYAGPTGGSDGPFYIFGSPQAYFNAIAPYVPVIRSNNYQHVYVNTTYLIDNLNVLPAWWPGPPQYKTDLVDVFAVRFYAGEGGHSGNQTEDTLDSGAAQADLHGKPFGLAALEIAQDTNTEAQGDTFLQYVLNFFQARQAAGKPIHDICWTSINTSLVTNNIYSLFSAPASYISYYQKIFNAFD